MALVDLTNDFGSPVGDGWDNVVIVDNFKSKRGGASLDTKTIAFPKQWIRAGHVILKRTADGEFVPMPLNGAGTAYAALPAGHTYYGILLNTISVDRPFAGIMLAGTVNPKVVNPQAGYYDIAPILGAVQTAFRAIDNHIQFKGDNE